MSMTPLESTAARIEEFDLMTSNEPEQRLAGLFDKVSVTEEALDEKRRSNENEELVREKTFDDELHKTVIESLKKSPGNS